MIDMQKEYNNWINCFYDRIFNKDYDSNEYAKLLKFKNSKLPDSLFQYTRVKYADDLLNKNLMFINQFNKLNDPFEANIVHNFSLYHKRREMLKVDESYKERYRVACFSQDNDIAPMWAFYGDNHKGICVEYNFHKDINFRDFCFPVRYVGKTDNDDLLELILEGENPINGLALELFVKKSQNWSYEKEWRLVFYDDYDYGEFQFVLKHGKKYVEFLKPKAVYLGLKITPKCEEYIKDLCNCNDIEVYKMYEDLSGYNLLAKKL